MNSIELFSGAGGLGMGIGRAGFKQLLAIDKSLDCVTTITHNKLRGVKDVLEWNVVQDDVRYWDFSQFENQVSLLSGGPPCQPFSLGGKHKGNLDERNSFPDAIRAVREIKPKAFIFENVRGLMRKTFANYFEYIILQLSYPNVTINKNESFIQHLARLENLRTKGTHVDMSYNVVFNVINAADFGLPQIRERVFIVGFRSDVKASWHFPNVTHSSDALLQSMLEGQYWEKHKVSKRNQLVPKTVQASIFETNPKTKHLPWLTVRDIISDLPDPEKSPRKSREYFNHTFQPGAKAYLGHTGSVLDYPAKTLKAGIHGVPGGENAIRRDDDSLRYFTVRESARLQGFPDEYSFDCSWGQAMMQLGNAVPVTLAEILAKSIKKALIKAQK